MKQKVGKLYRKRIVEGDINSVNPNSEIHISAVGGGGSYPYVFKVSSTKYYDLQSVYQHFSSSSSSNDYLAVTKATNLETNESYITPGIAGQLISGATNGTLKIDIHILANKKCTALEELDQMPSLKESNIQEFLSALSEIA